MKLIDLSKSEIDKKLEKDKDNIFQNKYFIYPVGSITLVIAVFTVIGITIYIKPENIRDAKTRHCRPHRNK